MKALLLVLALLLSQDRPVPQDAPEEGKPASCDNFHATPEAHRCACGKAMHSDCSKPDPDVSLDRKCKTYCRSQHCLCLSACTT